MEKVRQAPLRSVGTPWAVGGDYDAPNLVRSSAAFGAFATALHTCKVTPPAGQLPDHSNLFAPTGERSGAVIGALSPSGAKHQVAQESPDSAVNQDLVQRCLAAKPEMTVHTDERLRKQLTSVPSGPLALTGGLDVTGAVKQPSAKNGGSAPAAQKLTEQALRSIENWRYQHTPCREGTSNLTVASDVPGPQVSRWVAAQHSNNPLRGEPPAHHLDPMDCAENGAEVRSGELHREPLQNRGAAGLENEAKELIIEKLKVNNALDPKPIQHTTSPRPASRGPLAPELVVQSVGGPPPTSIARRTLETIKKEREAQVKARWILEAPARAEALHRRVNEILLGLRRSVEAQGFTEPTKGSGFVIKVCRQFTSTTNDEMDYDGFKNVLEKGFKLQLPEDQIEALFSRIDIVENTRPTFRSFGEAVFDLVKNKPDPKAAAAREKVEQILDNLRTQIAQRSGQEGWMHSFVSAFRVLLHVDGVVKKELSESDLRQGLRKLGLQLSIADCRALFDVIDTDRSKTITEQEFLHALRGRVSRQRRQLIFQAFCILDEDHNGEITVEEVAKRYSAAHHPRVLSGEATETQILKEFMAGWDHVGNGTVSWEHFLDYYKTLSCSIENDDYFELMMRNCWHISGGEGAAENTTCRRVLVIFKDGSQKIVEINDDLGITAKDMPKIKQRLEDQGITEFSAVELFG